jgi:UDP-2,4-diacetamido-2,4,6-trideoxy-beta-L-altropyranose hydrolase
LHYFFRVDASSIIGTGHVNRCLTLAKKLGPNCIFICATHDGNLINTTRDLGYKVETITPDEKPYGENKNIHSDWLGGSYLNDAMQTKQILTKYPHKKMIIVDHYAIAQPWQALLREHASSIMVIDDLADRQHDCDFLLDSNLYLGLYTRYDKLVPATCHKMLGIKYALLRDEFSHAPKRIRTQIKNVLVFFGGVDLDNHTAAAITSLDSNNLNVIVLVGSKNLHAKQIEQLCHKQNLIFKTATNSISALMAWADISIGAGGGTTWERIALGLPCITYSIAHNQRQLTHDIIKLGLAFPADKQITSIDNISEISTNCLKKSYCQGAEAVARALKAVS